MQEVDATLAPGFFLRACPLMSTTIRRITPIWFRCWLLPLSQSNVGPCRDGFHLVPSLTPRMNRESLDLYSLFKHAVRVCITPNPTHKLTILLRVSLMCVKDAHPPFLTTFLLPVHHPTYLVEVVDYR